MAQRDQGGMATVQARPRILTKTPQLDSAISAAQRCANYLGSLTLIPVPIQQVMLLVDC